MKLVEIFRGKQTDDETIARAFDVQGHRQDPDHVVSLIQRGFFTSRVGHFRHGRRGRSWSARHPGRCG
jgi:3-hydroxyacyl-CoA dehydrogenase